MYLLTALPPPPSTTIEGVGASALLLPNNTKEPIAEINGDIFKRSKIVQITLTQKVLAPLAFPSNV